MRIGYFVSEYPARSHTFIRREIAALSNLGFVIVRASIRKPNRDAFVLDELDEMEYNSTTSILPTRTGHAAKCLLLFLLQHPHRFFSSALFCFKTSPIGVIGFFKGIAYFLEALILADHFKKQRVEFVHVHFGNAGAHVGALTARLLHLNWGLSLHGFSDFNTRVSSMLSWQVKDAAFTRCISLFGKSQAMLFSEQDQWWKIFVAYCGIPVETEALFTKAARNGGFSELPLPFHILTIGRLSPEKGQFLLLMACARLKASGFNIRCTIIGEGPQRFFLQNMMANLGIADICSLAGSIPESQVYAQLKQADAFVLTSLMEGIPQVILEAMQSETPVVAPLIAGIPEVITHGVDGFLFSPADEDSLVMCLTGLINSPAMASTLGTVARQTALRKFDLFKTITPLAEHIASGITQKRDA